jgi:hypothetical protein
MKRGTVPPSFCLPPTATAYYVMSEAANELWSVFDARRVKAPS